MMLDLINKSNRYSNAIGISIIFLSTIVFFWPLILGGDWHIPHAGGDLESFIWPTYRFAAKSIQSGTLPLWNPYLHSGSPFAADNQSGLFYPPNIILAIFPDVSYRVIEWLVILHIFIAGAGMYYASKYQYRCTTIYPPLAASLAFQFSSIFVTHVGNLNIIASASYLPWAWFFMQRLRDTRSYKSASIVAIPLSLSILSGHAQISLIICIAIFVFSVWNLKITAHKQKWLTLITYTAVLTVGLSAISILPSIEMSQYTQRASYTYQEASRFNVPIEGLAGMISPLLYGRGSQHFWPSWDRVELGFTGLTTLFLATLGLRLNKPRASLLLVGAIGLIVALGNATPVHKLMYDYLPGFSLLRVPARFILLTNFTIAMLACAGLHYWETTKTNFNNIWRPLLITGLSVIVVLSLAWYVTSQKYPDAASNTLPIALFICLITLGSIAIVGHRWIVLLIGIELIGLGAWIETDYRNPEKGYIEGPAVQYLRTQPGPYRIDVAASSWQPNAPLVHQIESINGLHNPMTLAHYDNYYWSVNHRGSPQYNFLNAKFLITDKDKPAADSTFVPIYDEDSQVDIYLNTNSLARINLIYNTINVDNEQDAFDAIHNSDFDPNHKVVVQNGIKLNSSTPGADSLSYSVYDSHSQTIQVSTTTDAYLVFSEVWYPGWSVTINGKPSQFTRANFAFRSVYIPKGDHTVTAQFQPQIWQMSLGLSLSSMLILIFALNSHYFSRSTRPNEY